MTSVWIQKKALADFEHRMLFLFYPEFPLPASCFLSSSAHLFMEPTVTSAWLCHRHVRRSLHPIEVGAVSVWCLLYGDVERCMVLPFHTITPIALWWTLIADYTRAITTAITSEAGLQSSRTVHSPARIQRIGTRAIRAWTNNGNVICAFTQRVSARRRLTARPLVSDNGHSVDSYLSLTRAVVSFSRACSDSGSDQQQTYNARAYIQCISRGRSAE